jgi:hypothetical protein
MDQASGNTLPGFAKIDEALSSNRLLPQPKALLLLRICQLAQYLRPDIVDHYWLQLQPLHKHLPPAHQPAYRELKAARQGGGRKKKRIQALADIFDSIEAGAASAAEHPDEAKQKLESARQRLRGLWWWPFGKAEAWPALVLAFAAADWTRSLDLLSEAPEPARRSLIIRLNDKQMLAESEWDALYGVEPLRAMEAITELLDRDKPPLRLSAAIAQAAGEALLNKVHAAALTPDAERQTDAERDKALVRYKRLVAVAVENAPDTAEALMERLFTARATTSLYDDKWLDRFISLSQIITFWASVPGSREKAREFFRRDCPQHMRDFAVAQWTAMFPANRTEADAAWESERGSFKDPKSAEAWFLVVLVRRGLGRDALAIAYCAESSAELMPRVRKAVLCEFADPASLVDPEDVQGDVLGAFLRGPTVADRVEFLRERTERGKKVLPAELWTKPSITAVGSTGASKNAEPNWYKKDQAPDTQFRDFLRLHAYGQYSCEVTDPPLLAALIAWDEQHPEETKEMFSRMWGAIQPADWELRLDIFRNTVFERCQRVLPASPASYNKVFVQWVKRKLVDSPMQTREGNMIYTLSLKDITPFLHCLLGAQKLANVAPKRCDSLLEIAMGDYTATDDLVTWAAELYASDKGVAAIGWELPAKNFSHLQAWQTGVVEASKKEILNALAAGLQASAATA